MEQEPRWIGIAPMLWPILHEGVHCYCFRICSSYSCRIVLVARSGEKQTGLLPGASFSLLFSEIPSGSASSCNDPKFAKIRDLLLCWGDLGGASIERDVSGDTWWLLTDIAGQKWCLPSDWCKSLSSHCLGGRGLLCRSNSFRRPERLEMLPATPGSWCGGSPPLLTRNLLFESGH